MDVEPLTYSYAEGPSDGHRDSHLDFHPKVGRSVSIEQAAQLLGLSRRTVYYRIRDGRLRTIRTLGGSQRVLLDSVEQLRTSH